MTTLRTAKEFGDSVIQSDGQTRHASVIKCSQCGDTDEIISTKSASLPIQVMEQKFRQRGWNVAKKRANDVCPKCTRKPKPAPKPQPTPKPQPKTETPMQQTPKAVSSAAPPPQMTRDDRRRINAHLHDVYIDEDTGYADDWSDTKVATVLGVPPKWVSQIRAELFGDNAGCEADGKVVDEANELLKEARALKKAVEDSLLKAMEQVEAMSARVGRVETRIAELQKRSNG